MTEKNGLKKALEALDESGKLEQLQKAIRDERIEKEMRTLNRRHRFRF